MQDCIVYTDCLSSYNTLDVSILTHQCINHNRPFAKVVDNVIFEVTAGLGEAAANLVGDAVVNSSALAERFVLPFRFQPFVAALHFVCKIVFGM
ncbi:hypothetical protein [Kingella potus]|uniref:hypothetical protein n=1 Tax=Kingella potus TaxID=265175 RepID=UPI000E1BD4B9|nr:hypothetical protein [Kingella potus]UOP00112.1 hypothetical protein LVJ84_09075 [Kingella potus]